MNTQFCPAPLDFRGAKSLWATLLRQGFVLVISAYLGACSTFNEGFALIDQQIMGGEIKAARERHDQLAYPPRDRALQQLNQAMLLRLGGDLPGSNAAFESAKATMDELSRLSLAEQVSSLVSNDEFRAYEGQPHERIYLHLIKAINHLQLGELYSARVEVLQMDVLMRELALIDEKAVERAAPFTRYFSGLIHDALNEPSDAMIAYRQAMEAYRERSGATGIPMKLQQDLIRLTDRLGLTEEGERYRQSFDLSASPEDRDQGELVAIVFDGLAPSLREESVMWQGLINGGRLFRISLPAVMPRSYTAGSPQIRLEGNWASGELVDDLDRLVRADLDARKPAMAARAFARQAVKQGVASAAARATQRKADNTAEILASGLLSIGMQFAVVLTERADTRNWSTLPGRVWLIRQRLPAGQHRVQMEIGGRQQTWSNVRIAAGEKTFVAWHPLGPGPAIGTRQ